jgi:hypothetical protein
MTSDDRLSLILRRLDEIEPRDAVAISQAQAVHLRKKLNAAFAEKGAHMLSTRELARGGQPERPIAAAERNDGLHRAFAERARADHSRAPVIFGAPATILEAEAEPPLISTMTGFFLVTSPAHALNRRVSSRARQPGNGKGRQ